MRAVWQILLIAVLLIAVPLKGMAAISMGGCSPDHHGGSPEIPAHVEVADHAHPAAAPVAQDGKGHGASHLGDSVKGKCSQCAPCCLTAMLLTPWTWPQAQRTVGLTVFAPASTYLSAELAGLERPPRTSVN